MPIKSKAQLRWLGANHPDWISEWKGKTRGSLKKLPERVTKKRVRTKRVRKVSRKVTRRSRTK